MRQGEMRAFASALVMDTQGKISSASWARLFNDHANRIAAEATERTVSFVNSSLLVTFAAGDWTGILAQSVLRVIESTIETTATAVDGVPLRPVTREWIQEERSRVYVNGTPRLVAYERLAGLSGRMRVFIHPPPSATRYLAVRALIPPLDFPPLAIVDTSAYDLPQDQIYRVLRESAIDAANWLGRTPTFISSMLTRAAQLAQDQKGRLGDLEGPRYPKDEPL
jgi:hypothetical protein